MACLQVRSVFKQVEYASTPLRSYQETSCKVCFSTHLLDNGSLKACRWTMVPTGGRGPSIYSSRSAIGQANPHTTLPQAAYYHQHYPVILKHFKSRTGPATTMFQQLPRPTKTYHTKPYPAISPSRPELSLKGKKVLITAGGKARTRFTTLHSWI